MRIAICQAGSGACALYRDWAAAWFRSCGHDVFPLSKDGSRSEFGDMVFGVSFSVDLARMAKSYQVPYVTWFIDPLVDSRVLEPDVVSEQAILFHFSKGDLERFRRAGYRNVFYIPLAVPDAELDGGRMRAKSHNVGFVGNCYTPEASGFGTYQASYLNAGLPREEGLATLESFLDAGVKDLVTPLQELFLAHVAARQPDFFQKAPILEPSKSGRSVEGRLGFFIEDVLAHELDTRVRGGLIRALAPLGMEVWGDLAGWQPFLGAGARCHGPTANRGELGEALATSRVCVNVPWRITQSVNMRSFEIAAVGSLQLSLESPELAALFEPDREVVFFRTLEEAQDKARYFLAHDTEREAIAAAGRRRYLADHRLDARLCELEAHLARLGLS
jgi:spore maturation protein CgeB